VLFAAGFGKGIARGNQGVGNSLLSPERDKERAKGRGEGSYPTHPDFERGKGRDWRKARFFLLLFLLKKK